MLFQTASGKVAMPFETSSMDGTFWSVESEASLVFVWNILKTLLYKWFTQFCCHTQLKKAHYLYSTRDLSLGSVSTILVRSEIWFDWKSANTTIFFRFGSSFGSCLNQLGVLYPPMRTVMT